MEPAHPRKESRTKPKETASAPGKRRPPPYMSDTLYTRDNIKPILTVNGKYANARDVNSANGRYMPTTGVVHG